MLSQTQQVSIFELAIYALLIPLTLFVLVRHGNQGILGWIYLNLFEALRLAGAGLTIGDSTSTGVLIINAVGLSPLLLANAGVIREMNLYVTQDPETRKRHTIVDLLVHVLAVTAVALSAVGVASLESSKSSSNRSKDEDLFKAGVLLMLVAIVTLGIYSVFTFVLVHRATQSRDLHLSAVGRQATKLSIANCIAIPFLLVRSIYGIHLAFNTSQLLHPHFASKVACQTVMQVCCVLSLLVGGLLSIPIRQASKHTASTESTVSGRYEHEPKAENYNPGA